MSEPGWLEHRGCRFSYTLRGDGPPVLLIQGPAVHGDGWNPQVEGLKDRYRCLSFDNRGMGKSQPLDLKLTVDQMAEDARMLMDAQGWKTAHVVGHSLGGLIALNFALNSPDRVRSLSLLCTIANGRDATRLTGRMLWIGTRTRIGTRRQRRHAFLELVLPPHLLASADKDRLAAELEPLFGHDLADQPPVTMKQLSAMRAYDCSSRLAELADVPTLVVAAVHDPIAPPEIGRKIAAGIPGSRYVELEDASHGVPIHDAPRINTLLADHFAAADARAARLPA